MPFTDSDIQKLSEQVKKSEGLRLSAYRCTSGALTIGWGHNCDASPVDGVKRVGDTITLEQAETLFERDLTNAVWQTRENLPWVLGLNPARQAVIYDMAFNMGLGDSKRGLLSFNKISLPLIKKGEYALAARNMLASRWAKRVKGRAVRLTRQLETGEWQ